MNLAVYPCLFSFSYLFIWLPVYGNIVEANYDVNNKRISKNFISCMTQQQYGETFRSNVHKINVISNFQPIFRTIIWGHIWLVIVKQGFSWIIHVVSKDCNILQNCTGSYELRNLNGIHLYLGVHEMESSLEDSK